MNMVPLTVVERCLIKCLRVEKSVECFPNDARISREKVEKRTLNHLVRKIDKTGSVDQASDSGRRRSARRSRMHENIQVVEELICS